MEEVNIESHNMGPTFYRLTSLSFHINWPSHSEDKTFPKFDLENPRSRWGESWKSQSGCNILLTHIPFVPCQSAIPSLRYCIFKIWPWKSKVNVMGDVDIESRNILSTHIPLIPCQSVIPFLRYDCQNSTLKIQGQGHGRGERWNSQSGCNILSTHIPFVPCQSALPFLRYSIFLIWPWKSEVKDKLPWCCTTTGLDNSIELQIV